MTRKIKLFAFMAAVFTALAAQAFDTPYLTFRSTGSFSLSGTSSRWTGDGGYLEYATSNPADSASWTTWTGSYTSAVLTDGQYYIYLRGKDNTTLNNSSYGALFSFSYGASVYCEGDIEALRDYEGNPPAMLTFSDGDVFVNPLQGYGYRDVITTAYYIHGNLYTETYDMGINKDLTLTVEDELLTISETSYPIVKIGSGFWTRKNMTVEMSFGSEYRGRFRVYETLQNGMLYAQIFGKNSPFFLTNYQNIYGTEVDNATAKAIKWYLPTLSDKRNLTDYLGRNHKSLMKGQPSGFDAEFAGFYGSLDPRTGENLWDTKLRDVGQYCYIPFKTLINSTDGQALVLAPDYTWQSYSIASSHNNYFPVRLFRTNYFRIQ